MSNSTFRASGIRRDELRLQLARLSANQRQLVRESWTIARADSLLLVRGIDEATPEQISAAYQEADAEFEEIAPAAVDQGDEDDQVRASESLEAYRDRMYAKYAERA